MKSVEIKFGTVIVTKWNASHVVVDLTMDSKKDFQTLELIDGDKKNISKLAGGTDGSYVMMLNGILTLEEVIEGIRNYNGGLSKELEDVLRGNFLRRESKIINILEEL